MTMTMCLYKSLAGSLPAGLTGLERGLLGSRCCGKRTPVSSKQNVMFNLYDMTIIKQNTNKTKQNTLNIVKHTIIYNCIYLKQKNTSDMTSSVVFFELGHCHLQVCFTSNKFHVGNLI